MPGRKRKTPTPWGAGVCNLHALQVTSETTFIRTMQLATAGVDAVIGRIIPRGRGSLLEKGLCLGGLFLQLGRSRADLFLVDLRGVLQGLVTLGFR
jgi:hypothetical protein